MSTEPQSPDDIDRLLGTYLKAQLPQRWPDAPVATEPTHPPATGTPGQSRLTLALSLAVLLGFGLFLSTGSRPPLEPRGGRPSDNLLPASTAEGGKLFRTVPTEKK